MNENLKKYISIMILAFSASSIYLLPYVKYVFYDAQLEAMGITNTQSGMLLSVYALGCMALYIPGGILADKISAKKGLIISLVGTAILTIIYGLTLSYGVALVTWFLLAVSTGFVFWTALMKTISLIGESNEQGRMFGIYYACYGIIASIFNFITLKVNNLGTNTKQGFVYVVLTYAVINIIAAVLVLLAVPNDTKDKVSSETGEAKEQFDMSQVVSLLKNPVVWLFSIVIFSGYSLYSSSSYFTPYLTNVIGVSAEQSGILSIIRTYLFQILAPIGGYFADKVFKSTSKWFMIMFGALTAFYVSIIFLPSGVNVTLVTILSLIPGALAMLIYGIVFSIIGETKIPVSVTATAIGIASIIGYAPDLFMSTLFGSLLDKLGNAGYNAIFLSLAIIGVIGFFCALSIRKRTRILIEEPKIAEEIPQN
jgi:predicted MFS family arabinose efflux permease